MRRIGSNIRKQNSEAKANRITKNIIRYNDNEKPLNDYPRRIVSPARPSPCCSEESRTMVGTMREVDGFKFCYKVCDDCGHAVRFYFPATETTIPAVKEYRQWKRYMVQ